MNKALTATLLVLGALLIGGGTYALIKPKPASIPAQTEDQSLLMQKSPTAEPAPVTSRDTSVTSLEADLDATVILEEDFSDLTE